MRQKFDINASFTLYENLEQNINFGMVYTIEFLPLLYLSVVVIIIIIIIIIIIVIIITIIIMIIIII